MTRKIEFLGGTKDTLRSFPKEVKEEMGFALHAEQKGITALDVVPLTGYGSSKVRQIVSNFKRDTYRLIYSIQHAYTIYVLHVFMKKSKQGSKVPREDADLVKLRLKQASEHWRTNYGAEENTDEAGGQNRERGQKS